MPDSYKALQAKWKRKKCLDIRRTGNGRWYDQKVTPDVMAMISKVIVSHLEGSGNTAFTVRDLWKTEEFRTSMVQDFGKPDPMGHQSSKEYDKLIRQPLRVFQSALILGGEQGGRDYSVVAKHRDILDQMANSEQASAEFLNDYIQEVLRQSAIDSLFNAFFNNQNKGSYDQLINGFAKLIKKHTAIRNIREIVRIFSKVLNIQAYFRRSLGSYRGGLSKAPISLSDIRYNQINLIDARKNKPKHVTRRQAAKKAKPKKEQVSSAIQRVIDDVKEYHNNQPEILDRFSAHDPHKRGQVQGHHIFPRSEYPALAEFRENIILLTPTQHISHAHAGHRFSNADPAYQLLCLIKKLAAVDACEKEGGNFYTFDDFKRMLYAANILEKNYEKDGHDEVLRKLTEYFIPEGTRQENLRVRFSE